MANNVNALCSCLLIFNGVCCGTPITMGTPFPGVPLLNDHWARRSGVGITPSVVRALTVTGNNAAVIALMFILQSVRQVKRRYSICLVYWDWKASVVMFQETNFSTLWSNSNVTVAESCNWTRQHFIAATLDLLARLASRSPLSIYLPVLYWIPLIDCQNDHHYEGRNTGGRVPTIFGGWAGYKGRGIGVASG
jgi:hypothetical protein